MTTQTKTTWREVKLGDIADLNMGQSPKSEFYNDRGEGLPFFQGVTDFGERKPAETMYCSKPTKIVERGDVLISVRAPVGDVNIAEKESCIGRGVAGIRAKDKNNEFIYYLLLNFKDYIRSYSGGTTYESINKDALRDLEFSIPESPTARQQIADVLSTYDDLIENNTRRIKILEETAQAIYREWFVNFRFPGHEKVKMIDSGSDFGKIPEGWEIKKIGEIFSVKYGKNLPKTKITEFGNFPVYGAGGVIGFYNEKNVDDKTALITSRGNGSGTVWRTRGAGFVTNNSFIVTGKDKHLYFNMGLIYNLLLNANVRSSISGSAQPQVTINSLDYVEILVPEKSIAEKFQNEATHLYDLSDQLFTVNKNLRQSRDLLLPKLVTGEIRV